MRSGIRNRASLGRALVAGTLLLAAGRASAATKVLPPSDDTFINQGNPNNNNGASFSIFTGTDGHGGVMRGLVRFAMPAALQGRVTVTGVALTMTVEALGDGSAGTGAVETLQALTQPWVQGNGVGNLPMTLVVGQPCGGAISGATWNQPDCPVAASWTSAGGTVAASASGQADTTGVPVGGQVVWSSTANPRMTQDLQGWIDNPPSNDGWRVASSTEGFGAEVQRYFSMESGASGPVLSVSYDCKPGFVASGTDCLAANAVPAVGPIALTGLVLALGAAFTVVRGGTGPRSARAARSPTAGTR